MTIYIRNFICLFLNNMVELEYDDTDLLMREASILIDSLRLDVIELKDENKTLKRKGTSSVQLDTNALNLIDEIKELKKSLEKTRSHLVAKQTEINKERQRRGREALLNRVNGNTNNPRVALQLSSESKKEDIRQQKVKDLENRRKIIRAEREETRRQEQNEKTRNMNLAAELESNVRAKNELSSSVSNSEDFGIIHVPFHQLMGGGTPYPCFETQTPEGFIHAITGNLGNIITIEGKDTIDSSDSGYDTLGQFSTTCGIRGSMFDCKPKITLKNSLNNNKDELCWTLAHELGHFVSHNKRHLNHQPHLGKMLEEGFAEVFAMIALPQHPKSLLIQKRISTLDSSESYLDLLTHKWNTSEQDFKQSYEILPAYIAKYIDQSGVNTLDELITQLYTHRRV